MHDVTFDAVFYRIRRANALKHVLSIKLHALFFNKKALLIIAFIFIDQNYFSWHKGAIYLFFTHFIVPF